MQRRTSARKNVTRWENEGRNSRVTNSEDERLEHQLELGSIRFDVKLQRGGPMRNNKSRRTNVGQPQVKQLLLEEQRELLVQAASIELSGNTGQHRVGERASSWTCTRPKSKHRFGQSKQRLHQASSTRSVPSSSEKNGRLGK